MPWAFAYFGYGIGIHAPGKASFTQFLKAAHTINLAQGEAFRAIKAAPSNATVGSAYSMAPAYPKTDTEADRAAMVRYNAMNNYFFLNTAIHGEHPKAFVGEVPFEAMGFKAGDNKIMQVPWTGSDFITTRGGSSPMPAAPEPVARRTLVPRANWMKQVRAIPTHDSMP
jgi:beta-glucosidase